MSGSPCPSLSRQSSAPDSASFARMPASLRPTSGGRSAFSGPRWPGGSAERTGPRQHVSRRWPGRSGLSRAPCSSSHRDHRLLSFSWLAADAASQERKPGINDDPGPGWRSGDGALTKTSCPSCSCKSPHLPIFSEKFHIFPNQATPLTGLDLYTARSGTLVRSGNKRLPNHKLCSKSSI